MMFADDNKELYNKKFNVDFEWWQGVLTGVSLPDRGPGKPCLSNIELVYPGEYCCFIECCCYMFIMITYNYLCFSQVTCAAPQSL